ncbi:MAG: replicative DNA helicase [Clostridia bacterium]|nr:replicative DNA helicase [Clostridia bacterium]
MSELVLSEEKLRKMPFSMEAEQSVLGAIVISPELLREVINELHADDFYIEQHVRIYEAMRDIFVRGGVHLDEVTLRDELVKNGTFDEAGGESYIKLLAQTVPSVSNLGDYVKIIKDKALLRRLIEASEKIAELSYGEKGETSDILDRSEQLIFDVAEKHESKDFSHIRDVILENLDHLENLRKNGEAALGTQTYFSGIDKLLVGMGKGDFVLIGARPGMGKTSFALNIAANVALKTKKTVAIFSLEMSCEQLVTRMLSSEALIDSYKLRKGDLNQDDFLKLAKAASVLSEANILIDDTTGITVAGMKAKLRRVNNLGLVVVDYLQLMQSDRKVENRVNEIGDITRALKVLAKELGVPVITCAQLSRGPENRTDKTPVLSDLRDSGNIEQDADVVMLLYRKDYYDNENTDLQSTAQCIIAKNRHGSTGKVTLGWSGQFTKFITMDEEH